MLFRIEKTYRPNGDTWGGETLKSDSYSIRSVIFVKWGSVIVITTIVIAIITFTSLWTYSVDDRFKIFSYLFSRK